MARPSNWISLAAGLHFTVAAYGQVLAVHAANTALSGTSEAAFKSNLGYSGEQWDASLQMQNLRARAYDPRNGRFIGLDPFAGNMQAPQSLHKYAYVHGDPIQMIDPTGLEGTLSVSVRISVATSIGISFAISAMLYNSASNLIGAIAETAVLRATAVSLQVDYATDFGTARDRENRAQRYFVHGTTTKVWRGLAANIQVFTDGRPLDFGYGFYTRLFDLQGYSEVSEFATRRSNSKPSIGPVVSNKTGGIPFVLVYAMSWVDWNSLSSKYYGQPSSPTPDFSVDVNVFRSDTGPSFAFKDVVYGPTAVKVGGIWVADPSFSNQYKFEHGGISKLRPAFLLPAVDLRGPNLA